MDGATNGEVEVSFESRTARQLYYRCHVTCAFCLLGLVFSYCFAEVAFDSNVLHKKLTFGLFVCLFACLFVSLQIMTSQFQVLSLVRWPGL